MGEEEELQQPVQHGLHPLVTGKGGHSGHLHRILMKEGPAWMPSSKLCLRLRTSGQDHGAAELAGARDSYR